jgi:hypothetical protein
MFIPVPSFKKRGRGRMGRSLLRILLVVSSLVLCQCGGGGGGSGGHNPGAADPPPETNPPQFTNSAVFVASDDSFLEQIGIVFKKISVVNTTTGAACDLRTEETLIDVEALSTEFHLLNFANCPLDDYDSIRLQVADEVLISSRENITQLCTLDSFRLGETGVSTPFSCDAYSGTCEATIPASIELEVDRQNIQTLNFNMAPSDLRDFPHPFCRAVVSVSTLSDSDVQDRLNMGYDYAVTGSVFSVDRTRNTFQLFGAGRLFVTHYSGSDSLISFAQNNGLRVKVLAPSMDLETTVIPTWKIFLKLEGIVTKVGARTFGLALIDGGREVTVDYRGAVVSGGSLAVGQPAHVKVTRLTSHNVFIAEFIDIGEIGMEN